MKAFAIQVIGGTIACFLPLLISFFEHITTAIYKRQKIRNGEMQNRERNGFFEFLIGLLTLVGVLIRVIAGLLLFFLVITSGYVAAVLPVFFMMLILGDPLDDIFVEDNQKLLDLYKSMGKCNIQKIKQDGKKALLKRILFTTAISIACGALTYELQYTNHSATESLASVETVQESSAHVPSPSHKTKPSPSPSPKSTHSRPPTSNDYSPIVSPSASSVAPAISEIDSCGI